MPSPFLGKAFSWACKRLTQNMVKNNANMILSLNFIGDMLLMRTKITLFRDIGGKTKSTTSYLMGETA